VLPAAVQNELAEHKRYNDLESWIYTRIAYTDANPLERIDFLMRTQQEAWRSYKNNNERQVWFDLLSLQGYYQLQNGNILSSISAYETALEFYEAYPLPGVDVIENVLKPLGNNYTRLADYKTALFIHEKTLALALKKNDRQTIASVYSNMAVCARWQGNLQAALSYCRTGIGYVSAQNALPGLLLSTWADILSEQNKYDTALIVVRQALVHKQSPWYTASLQIASRIAWKQGQYKQAVTYGRQALQNLPSYKIREKAKLLVLLGDIHNTMHKAREALNYHQQALSLLLPNWHPSSVTATPSEDQLYSENTIADALNGKAVALAILQQPEQALQHYLASFMAERKLRREFFYAESKLRELQVTRSRVEAAMKLAYRLRNTNQLLLIAEISRAQVLMDERSWRLQQGASHDSLYQKSKQLQNAIVYYQQELLQTTNKQQINSLLQSTEYELGLLQKKLKAETDPMLSVASLQILFKKIPFHVTVLEFFAGRDSSFIIELNQAGIQNIYCIGDLHDTIQTFMQKWFAHGPSNMINNPRSFYQSCHALYRSIFQNYAWKKGNHYLLMTDGMFNYLPYDALITEAAYRNNYADWPYLCKQVSISQAYSLQTWYEQQTAHYSGTAFNAFFVSKGLHAQQPALSIEEEYKVLKQKISGHFVINESATRQAFNAITDSTAILHISTHAISSAADSFPYLQLYDKPFYLFDLRYKRFAPALVVLGACKTADGVLLEGEGVNSISRGFTAAGAGGVVSGLWNVHDQAAIEMIQDFYAQLSKQDNPALALHLAKGHWLKTDHANNFLHLPYYWAGFVYSGHLQKVQVQAAYLYAWLYWLIGLVALVGIIWLMITVRKKSDHGYPKN
jgi:CHAT domain-containing protein